jgi:hypothetical protein
VTLTGAECRELEAAAGDYERGGGRIVYGRQTYLRRAATIRGLLSRAGGQTSGQDPLGQSQSAPENTPACNATEPANRAVTLTDAEREALEWAVELADSLAECSGAGTGGEPSREAATIRGLLARAAKEGDA